DLCAYSHSSASWLIVTPRFSHRGLSASTFCRPSTSQARGRCERWSLSSNFVSIVYLPSSIPDECVTRIRNCGAGFDFHARNEGSNAGDGSQTRLFVVVIQPPYDAPRCAA